MKTMLLIICLMICVSVALGSESFWIVVDNWLTDDEVADFNSDGIVNLKDFVLLKSYGSDEYGIDSYGN